MNEVQPDSETGEARSPEPRPRLPYVPVASIQRLPVGERWLIDGILSSSSLTVLASTPKAGKTWVCLALATAVATGTQALGRFQVATPGSVLIYPAEDSPGAIRERIEALCKGQHVELTSDFPIQVITAESLKLDRMEDRAGLEELIQHLHPKLLILDPLVRLHSGSESDSKHIAELFGYLRILQRRFQLAILVTHHVTKQRRSSATQPGQVMRGSGDIHAAYDHGATITRQDDGSVLLVIEHRTAASPEPMAYRLVSKDSGAMTFEFVDPPLDDEEEEEAPRVRKPRAVTPKPVKAPRPELPLPELVLQTMKATNGPVTQTRLRQTLRIRNAYLTQVLHQLEAEGRIESLGRRAGWALRVQADTHPREEQQGNHSGPPFLRPLPNNPES